MVQPPAVPSVLPAAVASDTYVLDVREPDEWSAGHIRGAHHLPLGQLVERVGEIPTDRKVVVACRSGGRSAQATAYLLAQGRDVVNLDGGTQAWAAAGRAMDSTTGAPPAVA